MSDKQLTMVTDGTRYILWDCIMCSHVEHAEITKCY